MRRSNVGGPIVIRMLAAVLLGIVGGAPLFAQATESVEAGDRVRVQADDASGEFLVRELHPDRLVLRPDPVAEERTISTQALYRIEVYQGRTSRLVAALQGGVLGGIVGGLFTVPCHLPHGSCEGITSGERVAIGAGLGVAVGVLLRGGREIWEEARVPGQADRTPVRTADAGTQRRSGPTYISPAQLRGQVSTDGDAYSLVQQLHPNWLRDRASAGISGDRVFPEVFVNGSHLGGLDVLRDYTVADLRSLEFMEPQLATTRYGSAFQGGVILLVTR